MKPQIKKLVNKHSPILFFSENERHFPADPEVFRENSRFRNSNFDGTRDRGWNNETQKWEVNNNHDPEYYGTDWKTINEQIKIVRGSKPTFDGRNTRPRDGRNMWKDVDPVRGFFLELTPKFGRESSGSAEPNSAPIFYDLNEFVSSTNEPYYALSYWYFFIYNYHIPGFAHEGDWEHITLYFRKADFENERPPVKIYYAQHNGGLWISPNPEWQTNGHPHVYVLESGHPSYPDIRPSEKSKYTTKWETRRGKFYDIQYRPWRQFDGAWGEVGNWMHSTGPLGPFFKRFDKDYLERLP